MKTNGRARDNAHYEAATGRIIEDFESRKGQPAKWPEELNMDEEAHQEQMHMRDGFAAAALVGLLNRYLYQPTTKEDSNTAIAKDAFALAEAMMEVRAKRPLP